MLILKKEMKDWSCASFLLLNLVLRSVSVCYKIFDSQQLYSQYMPVTSEPVHIVKAAISFLDKKLPFYLHNTTNEVAST